MPKVGFPQNQTLLGANSTLDFENDVDLVVL